MKAKRRQKVLLVSLLMLGLFATVGLVLYALGQNINLYYTPTQITKGEARIGQSIRVGGLVAKNSVTHESDLQVRFKITDLTQTISIQYQGILPDLFRDSQGVILEGHMLDKDHFKATVVLAKHDENYMPPEVADSLKKTLQGAQ